MWRSTPSAAALESRRARVPFAIAGAISKDNLSGADTVIQTKTGININNNK